MKRSYLLVVFVVGFSLLNSCTFVPAPEVRVTNIQPSVGEIVIPGTSFTLPLNITFTSDNQVDAILRSVSFAAYYNGTLIPPSSQYPKKLWDGLHVSIPPSPGTGILLGLSIPITDEVNWMFIPPPDTNIAVELRLIFEGEDAFGEEKEWTAEFSSYSITRLD
ncbi:hypothetical protein IIA15_05550 [candidate division TA06 bacterium]|nr:hypothetical protein [candidate division TA06 bacterium]